MCVIPYVTMRMKKVWDLEVVPKGAKTIDCRWVYETKRDSKENIERYKARLCGQRVHTERRH